jgi:hypothetical protein
MLVRNLTILAALAGSGAALLGCGSTDATQPDASAPDASAPDALILDPDATIDGALIVEACMFLNNIPCHANERCAWIWDSYDDPLTPVNEHSIGHASCVPDGTLAVGEACVRSGPSVFESPGTGAGVPDQCVRDSYCQSETCRSLCDLDGGEPTCPANSECTRFSGLFIDQGMVTAGLCMPSCDPLTQVEAGSSANACGSAIPDAPDRGCFAIPTADGLRFACTEISSAGSGRTDGLPADGPAGGGSYASGCEAGYLPIWIDPTDDSVTICAGVCAAVPVDNTNPWLAPGSSHAFAKLHDQPMPRMGDGVCIAGKKGHDAPADCRFFGENLGVCFAFSEYTYDHDEDPATPEITSPSCAELPPAGGDPSTTIHNMTADEAGCYGPLPFPIHVGRPASGQVMPHVLR